MEPIDYASILGHAQGLQPDLAADQRQRAQLDMQKQQIAQQGQLISSQVATAVSKQARQAQYVAAVQDLTKNFTPQGAASLQLQFPEYQEAIKNGFATKDKAAQETDLREMAGIHGYLANGFADKAKEALGRRIEADKVAGQSTADDEELLTLINTDPEKAKGVTAYILSAITGPDKFASAFGEVSKGGEAKVVGAGGALVDPTGKELYRAPVSPQYRTIQTTDADGNPVTQVVQINGSAGSVGDAAPSGGGGDVVARMLPITLKSESGGKRYARGGGLLTSPAGAKGEMQVLDGTTASPGFGVQPARDNSPEERARVGRDYLAAMVERYGDPAKAWAAYNAGPGAVDRAIASNGSKWIQAVPAETRKYVARNMSALTKGAGAPVASQGAPSAGVVFQAPGTPKPRKMTPQEVAAEGLDPKIAYYRDAHGVPQAVSGQSRPTRQAMNLTEIQSKATGYLGTAVSAQNALNTVNGYDPSIVSLVLNDLSNKNPVKQNMSQTDRRVLNAQLAFATAVLRLESGAVVTKEEAAQKAQILFPAPGDGPDVQSDKRAQREAALRALRAAAGPGSASVASVVPNPYDRKSRAAAPQSGGFRIVSVRPK